MVKEKASIIVLTFNREGVIGKTVDAMLKLDYPGEYEVIVINDGSTDRTKKVLEEYRKEKKIRIINHEKELGPCKTRNEGIKKARFPFIVIMDDDCIPEKNWLKELMKGFNEEGVGMVSGFSIYGGTSTAFRKKALERVGLYDEDYFYYREDTDLAFRIMDTGYKVKQVKAGYMHEHKIEKPEEVIGLLRHGLKRAKNHAKDVLLYKKNPERAKKFLDVRMGFIVNPLNDFRAATGKWHEGGKLNLSSPRGIIFIENKNLLHTLLIFLLGISYVLSVKLVRLNASIKYGKLLI